MKYKDRQSDVGRLKQRLELYGQTTTSDGMGGTTGTPVKITEMWGDIKPVTGNERWDLESLKGVISHTVKIRYYEGITSENWFEYKGNKYYVKYPLNEGMENTYMRIAVTSEQND